MSGTGRNGCPKKKKGSMAKFKLDVINGWENLGKGLKPYLREAELEYLQPNQVRCWLKKKEMIVAQDRDQSSWYNLIVGATGRPSSIAHHQSAMFQYLFESRQAGAPVSTRMLVMWLSQRNGVFCRKKSMTKYNIVCRAL